MNDICRTCLSSSNLSPMENYESLTEKIEAISTVKVVLDAPNFPTVVCDECVNKINIFYCFQKVIINSDKVLKQKCASILNQSVDKKNSSKISKSVNCDKSDNKKTTIKKIKSSPICTSKLEDIKIETEQDISSFNGIINKEEVFIEEKPDKEDTCVSLKDKKLKCKSCMLDFTTKSELLAHRKTFHRTFKKEKSLYCNDCNITFTSQAKLLNHKRNTHTAPGICNICGMIVRADNLKKHVQRHSEEPANCNICLKVLKNSESLRGHLLIHKDTLYGCQECNRTFKLKSEYNRHLKKHTDPNIRKKMCKICGKYVRDIHRHLLTHSGERPFLCPYCNKGLKSSYALKLHIRQHTNEKPFTCEFCNKAFAQKISLLAHLKSKAHTEEKK
ncbi:gastrula zinc finger protein XlCGF26.1-like [Diorhabda sublineata]|uniref:gastrula zinc finger protein XlCGF26.1-like n=1 Tax=Diorhabda sublineata TaxID=1163346 RepID=UPI0024E0446B|nr:gastrula zinc finger protein XlCGF26.1-like [Diorhabda sublineata]